MASACSIQNSVTVSAIGTPLTALSKLVAAGGDYAALWAAFTADEDADPLMD